MLHIFIVPYFIKRVIGSNPNIRTQHNGITWSLAATDCGDNGLEKDETVIVRSNFPVNDTFWIGIATYSIETDWTEIGCYTMHQIDTDIFVPHNFTSCKNICRSQEYLAHKPKENKCACLKYLRPIVDPSQCESPNSFHVYTETYFVQIQPTKFVIKSSKKINKGIVFDVDEIRSPFSCSTGMIRYHFAKPYLVKGRRGCNNPLHWYICKNSDEHVSSTNANRMSFSVNILSTKKQNASPNRPNHKPVDVFNSVSQTTGVAHTQTTVEMEEKVPHEFDRFPFGAIVGGGLSVVIVIACILVLVLCKRSITGESFVNETCVSHTQRKAWYDEFIDAGDKNNPIYTK